MKKKPLSIRFPSRTKDKSKIQKIKNLLKSAKAAFLCTLTIIIVILSLLIITTKLSDKLIALGGIASAIATVVICFYTVKSVAEVIKSNKETAEKNHKRDIKETFEKNFSILLQEHNGYLGKIISANNCLYEINHILNCSGYESYSIIRGLVKFATVDGYKFCLHNDEILIQVDLVQNTSGDVFYYFSSSDSLVDPEHVILSSGTIYYSSGDKIYLYLPAYNTLSPLEDLSFISKPENITKLCYNIISSKGELARKIIQKNNDISKNILSPYMRIVYHLLKCASENTNSKTEMKKYTNIVRSIIPYDILILIAINSMFFYKSYNESKNELRRWSDFFNELDNDPLNGIFNDYHKYYQLLIKCDFFEHLNMNFSNIIPRFSNLELSIDLSFLKIVTFYSVNKLTSSGRTKYFLMIDDNPEESLIKIYKTFQQEIMPIQTDLLILLFFFEDTKIEHAKKRIMENIIYGNKNNKLQCRIKNKLINLILSDCSTIYKAQNRFYLARDFLEKFSKGELPQSFL